MEFVMSIDFNYSFLLYELNQMVIKKANENDLWQATMSLGEVTPGASKPRKRAPPTTVFTCPHCPYKSNRHFNIQRHERLAHSKKKPEFSCHQCGTSYSLEYRLKLHIKAVHEGEGHICHICKKTFETVTGLKSHFISKHKKEDELIQQGEEYIQQVRPRNGFDVSYAII